jgi:methyl-accepting chemotaxis protein
VLNNSNLNNNLTDKNKIIESIIYHFIFRIGSLIKSKKEINSRAIHFINSINQEYNLSNDSTNINATINNIHKSVTDSGRFARYPLHISLNTIIDKEINYLKKIINGNLIISTINAIEEVKEVTENIKEVTENVKEVTENVKEVTENIKEVTENVKEVTENVKEVTENVKEVTEKECEVIKDDVKKVESSYYSYCVIS